MKSSLLLFFFLSLSSFSQERPKIIEPVNGRTNYQIDWKYASGEYLIYDCERAHFACVDKDGQKLCSDSRDQMKADMKDHSTEKKEIMYPCAFLKKFDAKWECIVENYKVVDRDALKRFCYPR